MTDRRERDDSARTDGAGTAREADRDRSATDPTVDEDRDDAAEPDGDETLLSLRDLRTYYDEGGLLSRSPPVKAVDGVSLDIREGETLGLVGESGCGKTTLGRTLLGLETPTGGTVESDGRDLTGLSGEEARAWQRRVGMVFQDPDESLNDRQTVGRIVREPLEAHDWPTLSVAVEGSDLDGGDTVAVSGDGRVEDGAVAPDEADVTVALGDADHEVRVRDRLPLVPGDLSVSVDRGGRPTVSVAVEKSAKAIRRDRAADLLARVGLTEEHLRRYPHQFSGGQRQRVGIARALALEPDFLVLDEPVSALDVSVQARVINLLEDLQDELGLTYLFIAHDLSVVRHIADRVAVMYLGEIVEIGPTERVFEAPTHPYAAALLSAIPGSVAGAVSGVSRDRITLRGAPPNPRDPPPGCRFATRCPAKIRPDDVDAPEAVWAAVDEFRALLRERARGEDSPVAALARRLGFASDDSVATAREELFGDHRLPSQVESAVDEATDLGTDGEYAAAAARLRETLGSECDRTTPTDEPVGPDRRSKCLRNRAGREPTQATLDRRYPGGDGGPSAE